MSKSSIGRQKDGTGTLVALTTLFPSVSGMGKVELTITNPTAIAYISDNASGTDQVTIAQGRGFFHEYSAVELSTVFVNVNAGDTVVLVGEGVSAREYEQATH